MKRTERIEARKMETDRWVVGVFDTIVRAGSAAPQSMLVHPIADFYTPDGDPRGIARAKAYAEFLRGSGNPNKGYPFDLCACGQVTS